MMDIDMQKKYDPSNIEDKWYKTWMEEGLFGANPDSSKESYCILMPPPNITGSLHLGHTLNNTIQDILIRKARMQGYEALWIPGMDHAGIATQNKVEQYLAEKGKFRENLTREEFLKEAEKWKEKFGGIIVEQLKRLGISADWDRFVYTMDEKRKKAVNRAFVEYFEDGLIYKGNYIVNWCPRCITAISDLEVEHEEIKGKLWHLKYPIIENGKPQKEFIEVATTRPETMLGDMAVAVHPDDTRYKDLVGKNVLLPLVDREIPVIADELVDMNFGTGAVKITPAHDQNDYEISKKHNIEPLIVMTERAVMNDNAGEKYKGLSREEAREKVLDDLDELGLLGKIEDYEVSLGKCERCHTVIEPYLSPQWYISMKEPAKLAIDVIKEDKVKYVPERWKEISLYWLENVRDWPISRQLWWGHRLPIWYCQKCDEMIVAEDEVKKCPHCNSKDIVQDEDVLDTWFSSALWPISTMDWPHLNEDFQKFYPTDVLSTAPEIIYLWVARMIISGLKFVDEIPFKTVYLHTTVQTEEGKRMSKSLGTGIDPLDFIEDIGADAVRFTIATIATQSQSIRFGPSRFDIGRNFTNKIWNASRFLLSNYKDEYYKEEYDIKRSEDIWMFSRINEIVEEVTSLYDKLKFNDASYLLYEFFWHEFCDWYIEFVKIRLYNPTSEDDVISGYSLALDTLKTWLKLIHPIMPFITEEIWSLIPDTEGRIMISEWPRAEEMDLDMEDAKFVIDRLSEVIYSIRNIRGDMNIPPDKKVNLNIYPHRDYIEEIVRNNEQYIEILAGVKEIIFQSDDTTPSRSATAVLHDASIYIPLDDLIDIEQEINRINSSIKEMEEHRDGLKKRLSNENFLKKAPKNVVDDTMKRLEQTDEKIKYLKDNLTQLSGKEKK
jgi:valyl-tRNA synthetase